MKLVPKEEEDDKGVQESALKMDDSWLNASSDSWLDVDGGSFTTNYLNTSFADYTDLDQYQFCSTNNSASNLLSNNSSFVNYDSVESPFSLDASTSTVENLHASASSIDLAQFFSDEQEAGPNTGTIKSNRVQFGTVTVREFSLVYEYDNTSPVSSKFPCEAFRLTLDWNHAPDVVKTIPDLRGSGHPRRLTFSQRCNRLLKVRGWNASKRNLLTIEEQESSEEFEKRPGVDDEKQFVADHAQVA